MKSLLFPFSCTAAPGRMCADPSNPSRWHYVPTPSILQDVVIYLSEADIPADWKPIAIIHAQGEAQLTTESKMLRKSRERAAELGANGLLIEEIKEPSAAAQIAGEVLGTGSTRRGRVVAIRVFFDE